MIMLTSHAGFLVKTENRKTLPYFINGLTDLSLVLVLYVQSIYVFYGLTVAENLYPNPFQESFFWADSQTEFRNPYSLVWTFILTNLSIRFRPPICL